MDARPLIVTFYICSRYQARLLGTAHSVLVPQLRPERALGLGGDEELFSKVLCRSGWWGEVPGDPAL